MNYSALAILLMRGRGVLSSLIRWQTRGKYSHAALLIGENEIIEAWQGDGVRMKKITDWSNVDIFDVPSATPQQWQDAIDFACKQRGKGYDYLGVVRFLTRRDRDNPERWFCSELVFASFLAAGVPLLARIKAHEVSPGLLSNSPLLVQRT